MKVVPHSFYENEKITKILVEGLSCVIHKKVNTPDLQNERYVSTPALTIVLKGDLKIQTYDGLQFIVNRNKMVLIPKGLYMISDIIPKNEEFEAIVFFFEENIINEFLSDNNNQSDPIGNSINLVYNYSDEIQIFTQSLLKLYSDTPRSQHNLIKIKLKELLFLLRRSEEGEVFFNTLNSHKKKPQRSIKNFMQDNLFKPLSIEDYAYLTGRSLSTFRRDFIRLYGMPPKQWLIDQRLRKANELLRSNNKSVTDVAYEVGYENISHFIKAFSKKYEISPKQYLIKNRQESTI